jgi:hypothetical protein
MAVQEIVRLLRDQIQDDGVTLRRRHGPQAVTVAEDIKSLLAARLQKEPAYASLWSRFEDEPQAMTAELTGVLEALVEADPALVKRLNGFIEEFHQVIAPPRARLLGPSPVKSPVGGGVPDTTFTAEDDTDTGRGAYLYGNVRSSKVTSIGRGVRGRRVPIATVVGPDAVDVKLLFEQLRATVKERSDLDAPVKSKLEDELQGMLTQIISADGGDVKAFTHHLQNIRRLDLDIFEVVLDQLTSLASDLGPVAREAVKQVEDRRDTD